MDIVSQLQAGDCLLYHESSIPGVVTELKTWNRVCHVEVYLGNKFSAASRDGLGVNIYLVRSEQLAVVLRPTKALDFDKGLAWFDSSAKGYKYSWKGLLTFGLLHPIKSPKEMFCSQFATLFYRNMGLPVFGDYDASRVAPAQFLMTEDLKPIFKL